jgi:EAL domain-containing protein (putative c-di-GMP-specific phosphodiesterase class I)
LALKGKGPENGRALQGMGYSNLGCVKTFPLDQLKIDWSFVNDLPKSINAASIARAIVNTGHSLGLHAIASRP